MVKVSQYEIHQKNSANMRFIQSGFSKNLTLYEFRFFTTLDPIFKILNIFKIQQFTAIGLWRCCMERYFNQNNLRYQCYCLLSIHYICLKCKLLKVVFILALLLGFRHPDWPTASGQYDFLQPNNKANMNSTN